jgi:putative transposase
MAWELKKVEDQRKSLIEAYEEGKMTMSELCERYGISRKTAYKWYNRYKKFGLEGLNDLSRAPHRPNCFYSEDDMREAIDLKLRYWSWGPKKILAKLNRDYPMKIWPSATRLYEVFKKYNLVTSKRIRRRVPATHPLGELNESNDVWMADFKGWFLTQDRTKCELLTITDGYSRYLIRCRHLDKKSAHNVWTIFAEAFHEYGLPKRLRTDNGPPFASVGVGRLTQLSINLIKAGVVPEWINPGHPEENGRHERFHLTLKKAVASPASETFEEQLRRITFFEEEYNFERPHEGIGMRTPASCYCTSMRKWDGMLRTPEYDTQSTVVRKVGQNGCIWLHQKDYYLGSVLTGEYVGIKEENEGALKVYYGPVCLGNLKINEGIEQEKLKPKKIVRRG